MPYKSIEAAKEAGFPTTSVGAPLTLSQINKLAEIYDAIKADENIENPMAVAWTQWKKLYKKDGDAWVTVESGKSAVFISTFSDNSRWIPVAAVGQATTLSNGDKISLSKEALKGNLKTWTGGYINVNHEDKGEIEGLKIEDAKFEDDLLHFKVNKKLAEFIQHTASSGRSIEITDMKVDGDGVVKSYMGAGLAVLYPPFTPACTTDMGCSAASNSTSENPGTIKTIFSKLADKLKSQSFMDSMIETSGTDPNLEKTMTEDTDKLKFAKMEADKSRDEALKEVETLKFSLVEKDKTIEESKTALDGKDKLLKEQTDKLKFYADAEVAAAEKLQNDQWETLKSSIPPGKFHKPEDEAALKKEFVDDPATFTVKMATFEKVAPTSESGAEFGSVAPDSQEAKDMAVAERMGV